MGPPRVYGTTGGVRGTPPSLPGVTVQPPSAKVTSSALAGALGILITWLLGAIAHVEVPPEVAVALTTLLAFVVSYFVVDAAPTAPTTDAIAIANELERRMRATLADDVVPHG